MNVLKGAVKIALYVALIVGCFLAGWIIRGIKAKNDSLLK
jgi:hypothetical protein